MCLLGLSDQSWWPAGCSEKPQHAGVRVLSWHGGRAVALSFSVFSVEVGDLPRIKQLGATILQGQLFRPDNWRQELGCWENLLAGELVPNVPSAEHCKTGVAHSHALTHFAVYLVKESHDKGRTFSPFNSLNFYYFHSSFSAAHLAMVPQFFIFLNKHALSNGVCLSALSPSWFLVSFVAKNS